MKKLSILLVIATTALFSAQVIAANEPAQDHQADAPWAADTLSIR